MASPSVTYQFLNGQTSDGPAVNQNFTDLINGITDGTKDLAVLGVGVGNDGLFFNAETTLNFTRDGAGSVTLISANGTQSRFNVRNTSGTGDALISVLNANGTTGDCYFRCFTLGSASLWNFGQDTSNSNAFTFAWDTGALASGTTMLTISTAGVFTISTGTSNQHRLNTLLATNGAQTATMTNLPAAATSGNPNGWISININGTTSYIPFWH